MLCGPEVAHTLRGIPVPIGMYVCMNTLCKYKWKKLSYSCFSRRSAGQLVAGVVTTFILSCAVKLLCYGNVMLIATILMYVYHFLVFI